jgi:hypothetical protein
MELGPQRLSSSYVCNCLKLSAESLDDLFCTPASVYDGLEDNHAGRQKWPAYVPSVHKVQTPESIRSKGVLYLTFGDGCY